MASRPTKIRQAAALEKVMVGCFGHDHHDLPVAQRIRDELASCISTHECDLVGGSLAAWVSATTEKLSSFVKKGGTLHGGGPSQSLAPALGTRDSLSAFTGAPEAKPTNHSAHGAPHGEFESYKDYLEARKRGRGASLNVLGVAGKPPKARRPAVTGQTVFAQTLPSVATKSDAQLERLTSVPEEPYPDILFNVGGSSGRLQSTATPRFKGQKTPPAPNRS